MTFEKHFNEPNGWFKKALEEDPDGRFCAVCKAENFYYDDCGFWYHLTDSGYKAVCKKCSFEVYGGHNGDR